MKTKNSHKKLYLVGGTFIVLALALAGAFFASNSRYIYVSPKRGKIIEAIYGMGKVKSNKKYEVKVGILTHVKRLFVHEGQSVKRGAALIQFEDSAIFRAPFNGTVTRISYNLHDSVLPQSKVLTFQDLSDKYLEVSLEQEGALRVKKGQSATVLFESIRGETFQGQVQAIFPRDDEFLAHIQVEGLGNNVLPGMTADVSIVVGSHDDALLVPVSGLTNGHITIKRDGKKQKTSIKVGSVDGEWAEVLEGDIQDADQVLLKIKKAEKN